MSQFLLSGSSLIANINSSLSSCSHLLSAHHYLQIILLYVKDLTWNNSPFFSLPSFLAFFPKEGRGWRVAERDRGLELNTFRCINPLEKRILEPRLTRHLQGHLVQCLNVLPREAVWARKKLVFEVITILGSTLCPVTYWL